MYRYIITREQFKGQEYLISALYDEHHKMLEVEAVPETSDGGSILGNIYIGRVSNIVENLNAAFVSVSPEQNCYFPLEELKNPIFTKKQSEKKPLAQGDELLVQVSKEAQKTKEPMVTANLNFTGTYAVLTTGNRKLSISSKIPKQERVRYRKLLETFCDKADYGVIIRTNAQSASDEEILSELELLDGQYRSLVKSAMHRTCFHCLMQAPALWQKTLTSQKRDELETVITDDRAIFETICSGYGVSASQPVTGKSVPAPVDLVQIPGGPRITFYRDKVLTLSALYRVKTELCDALKERVWLKSGAYLIIQPTEALTVIDVNTGKNIAKKSVQESFLKINKEAAAEIARQLRLRNVSGMVLVDFMNLTDEEAKAELLSEFRKELKKDPVPVQLIDMTKLGLVELTRKKVRKSLREVLG